MENRTYINETEYFDENDKIQTDFEKVYNNYKISLEKRKNEIEQLITQIKNQTFKTQKEKQRHINFHFGFLVMIKVALADLEYFRKGNKVI